MRRFIVPVASLVTPLVASLVLVFAHCTPKGQLVASRVLCAAPDVLHAADVLAVGLDGGDKGWTAAIDTVGALAGLAANIGCDLTRASAQHLLADIPQQTGPGHTVEEVRQGALAEHARMASQSCTHVVGEQHRPRLNALASRGPRQ